MLTQTKTISQGLLFSEPSFAETGIWCELNEGINPAQWASLCRYIGKMSPKEFKKAQKIVLGSPDSIKNRLKRLFCFEQEECEGLPLVNMGNLKK